MSARVRLTTIVCLVWFFGRALGDCVLPQHPAHGHHQALGGDCNGPDKHPACDGTPGSLVPEDWLLTVRCDPGYEHPDPTAAEVPSVCLKNVWSIPKLPSCVVTELTADEQSCTLPRPPPNAQYRMFPEECGVETPLPGALVPNDCIFLLNCSSGYSNRIGDDGVLFHCANKTWSPAIPNDLCTSNGETPISTRPLDLATLPPLGCALPSTSSSRRFCSLANGCEATCDFDNEKCLLPPGSSEDQVKVVCAPGYSTRNPYNNDIAFCLSNGLRWYPPLPECHKLCPPLKSEMLLMTCRLGTNIVNCSKPALPDTTVSFECAPSFSEYPDLSREGAYRKIHTCKTSGEWSHYLPPCKPACGVFNRNIKVFTPTIYEGQKAYLGFFPWHAGLYLLQEKNGVISWNLSCGGSLISKRFILTAAHCVKDVVDDVESLRVALGKYYRSWEEIERYEQRRNVTAISLPSQYALATLAFDIALVLMSEGIKYGEYIMPVCRDMVPGLNTFQGNSLYVVGWGKTSKDGKLSDVLLFNTVTAMSDRDCRLLVPSFYNTYEKICGVGNNSESITQQGDSGGGLTATYRDGLHYIVGIVSLRVDHVSLFTHIKWKTHIDWMESEIRRLEIQYVRD